MVFIFKTSNGKWVDDSIAHAKTRILSSYTILLVNVVSGLSKRQVDGWPFSRESPIGFLPLSDARQWLFVSKR